MVVAQTNAANGREHIQELVAICIRDVVANRIVKVDRELDLLFARDVSIVFDVVQGLWARESCLDSGLGRLVGISLFSHRVIHGREAGERPVSANVVSLLNLSQNGKFALFC